MAPDAKRVLVTGATGFVGKHLVQRLMNDGWTVVGAVRAHDSRLPAGVAGLVLGDLRGYSEAIDLSSFTAVVHLAAKVHDMNSDDREEYLASNYRATRALATAAAQSGVRHFVFLSSIKVNGEQTSEYRPFRADDASLPQDAYALSKAEAEQALRILSQEVDGFAVTVIRSPLVYGLGVGANFQRLLGLADSSVPLPTGLEVNSRSLISVENLVSAISTVLAEVPSRSHTYLVRDGRDLSTAQLVQILRRVNGRGTLKLPVGPAAIRTMLRISGRQEIGSRLLGSLTVDDSPIRRELGWRPTQTVEQGMEACFGQPARRRKLMFLITEDWYFWSHRLPIARAARDAGWEVHIACRVKDHADRIRCEGFVLHPLPLVRGSKRPEVEIRALAYLVRLIESVRPDVLHNVALKPVLYGSVAGRRAGVPAIVNALAGLGAAFTGESRTLATIGLTATMRAAMRGDNHWLIVQNRDDARFALQQRLVKAWHLIKIPGSGVDPTDFPYSKPDGCGRSLLTATVVSRMLWDKGIGETVEAGRYLREWKVPVRIQLVGDPDPDNPRSISLEQLRAWDQRGDVSWLGRRSDIPTVWRDTDIAVLASYREGMPKSLLEAASVGRPIVTTDVPGCRELVEHELNGLLVPPRDAISLARAIASLAADPHRRIVFGREARRLVEDRFATAQVIEAHMNLYESVLGMNARGLSGRAGL